MEISSEWSATQLPNNPVKEDTTTVTISLEFGSTPNPLILILSVSNGREEFLHSHRYKALISVRNITRQISGRVQVTGRIRELQSFIRNSAPYNSDCLSPNTIAIVMSNVVLKKQTGKKLKLRICNYELF